MNLKDPELTDRILFILSLFLIVIPPLALGITVLTMDFEVTGLFWLGSLMFLAGIFTTAYLYFEKSNDTK